MGTGIAGQLLYNFPYPARWLRICGEIIGLVAGIEFVVFTILFISRFILYPEQHRRMMDHNGQSMFLGCIPMALATVTSMIYSVWREKAWIPCYVLWWIDVIISLICGWWVVFYMFARQKRTTDGINLTILLPVVPLVVASTEGVFIAHEQPEGLRASSAIVSLLLWANGVAVAVSCMVIYLHRMLLHNLPPAAITFSALLAVGPLGQGSAGIQHIGEIVADCLSRQGKPEGLVLASKYAGTGVGMCMLGYGVFWIVICIFSVIELKPRKFNMSWWALTFPMGVYANGWTKLSVDLDITALKVIACVLIVLEVLAMLMCTACSLYLGIFRSDLFEAAHKETGRDDFDDDLKAKMMV
uniref:ARAD1A09416p n=1 Tax=Blastobotrys adeninivorans TaxID=409370 RepID=A0A060SY40_BLAAD